MREILVSIEVFAAIWALRRPGEQTENDILRRVIGEFSALAASHRHSLKGDTSVSPQEWPAAHVAPLNDDTKEGKRSKWSAAVERSEGEVGMGKLRWVDDVYQVLCDLGGRASLHQIYKHVAAQRSAAGRSVPKTLDAIIRRTIEDHSSDSANFRGIDLFTNVGRGEWAIRAR